MNRFKQTGGRGRGARRLSRRELQTRSDEQLVELVLDGQDLAFELLFDRHVADAVWFAREVLGTWWEAEEAVRHSFAAAHAYLAARGREVEFAPWLHTIVGNHCLSMIQARTPGPGGPTDTTAVVDLDEWRRRRKRLAASVPFAPSAGLHDSVMTACGIGAGATTAAAPLLGATAAKVAIVAVLAGTAGVAGNVVSDAPRPDGAGGTGVAVERPADVGWTVASGSTASRAPWGEGYIRNVSELRERAGRRPAARGWLTPRTERRSSDAPSGAVQAPGGSGTPDGSVRVPGESPRPPAGSPSSAVTPSVSGGGSPISPRPGGLARSGLPAVAASAAQTGRAVLGRVGAAVAARVLAPASPPSTGSPAAVDLTKIGDDPGVVPAKPPVDVRALLSRVTNAPPK